MYLKEYILKSNKTVYLKNKLNSSFGKKQMQTRNQCPAPKKVKTVPSAGKVITTIVWNSRGVILLDYLRKKLSTESTTLKYHNVWPLQSFLNIRTLKKCFTGEKIFTAIFPV